MKKLTFKDSNCGRNTCIVHQDVDIFLFEIDGKYHSTFWLVKETNKRLVFGFYLANRIHHVNYRKSEFIIEY